MNDDSPASQRHPLILIDGSSWLFRAYHALPPLSNSKGQPTGAIYGMGNMLRRLLKDYAPEEIAVIFDAPGDNFRHQLYAEYKANRDETPEDLKAQYEPIREMIQAMGLPLLAVPEVEADDVIGTLAKQADARGQSVLIVTGDKDMAQLVNERVHLLDTMKNVRMDRAGVIEKFGVPPERIVDYLALMGDSVDNIPGIDGVGPKTAAKWLQQYGSLDEVVAHAEEVKGKIGEKLRAGLHILPLSRQLATIHCEVELPVALDSLRPAPQDKPRLLTLFRHLELQRWTQELEGQLPPAEDSPAPAANSSAPAETAAAPAEPPPRLETQALAVLDWAGFDAMLAQLQAAELVCVDTETDSLDSNQANLVGIAFAIEAGKGWYIPVAHDYLGAPAQLPRAEVLARLKPLLQDPNKPKLGQHIKYDLNVFARHGVQVAGIAHDTMLQSYVLDAAGNRHDMDTLALKYLNHTTIPFEAVAGKGKNQLSFNQVAIDKATEYSAEDADITLRLHQTLYPRLREIEALQRVYETIEMPLVPVLAKIEQTGVKIDVPLLGRISLELAERMQALQQEAFTQAGTEFNLGSPKQLGAILYEQLKLPVLGKTPKGEPSTAEDVLEELAAQHPLPRLILDWRAMQKLRSTYTEQLPAAVNPHTGRIHTSYHQAVAATGRLSSSDPNLQNIPVRNAEGRRIRQAFVAEPGNQLLAIDYSQIELRLMAHFSGDARLQTAFHEGRDIHQATAAEVFGLPLEAVGGEQRRAAKAINFGLIYGMSAFGLARQLGIARGEAQDYIERFFGRYPGVKQFMDGTRAQAREAGYVETLFGRRLYLPNIRSKNQALRQYAERTAINAPLQGTAADLIKLSMIDLHGFLQARAPKLRMIMQVHDELVFEGPAEHLAAMAAELAGRMVRIAKLSVPLVADFGLGSQWDAAHSGSGHASSG
ncbi:DNA polymerase I [Solimonas aquatica]|uniref:DNA polymerase I n=1 Tax=Solimonas aquatica TaxID=489703 RepID=A0A1H9EMI3_9GAMM|nr:DNA polymerase I [Solimonas aquatica]SEQ26218.1 DNA polymerase I [Solimonas aquatica]